MKFKTKEPFLTPECCWCHEPTHISEKDALYTKMVEGSAYLEGPLCRECYNEFRGGNFIVVKENDEI